MVSETDLIYLDYNATTPLAHSVTEKIYETMKDCWANPCSNSLLGQKARKIVEEARKGLATMLDAEYSDIIFTSGGTEASNMAIRSALGPVDKLVVSGKLHVVTSTVEHDATLKLIEHLEDTDEVEVTKVGVDGNGKLMASSVLAVIKPNTRLVTLMLANNETGVIFPIGEIARELKRVNAERSKSRMRPILLHTDIAQAVGKIPVSVQDLGCDYATIVGHKFYGPRIGCLYRKKSVPLIPLLYGGGQENGLRPGTENTPMIAGLGKAADLVVLHLQKYNSHMSTIRDYLETQLFETFGNRVKINFKVKERLPNIVSVAFLGGLKGHELLEKCELVVASTGAACHSSNITPSRVLMESLHSDMAAATLRLSVGRETTKKDIDRALEDLASALNILTASP